MLLVDYFFHSRDCIRSLNFIITCSNCHLPFSCVNENKRWKICFWSQVQDNSRSGNYISVSLCIHSIRSLYSSFNIPGGVLIDDVTKIDIHSSSVLSENSDFSLLKWNCILPRIGSIIFFDTRTQLNVEICARLEQHKHRANVNLYWVTTTNFDWQSLRQQRGVSIAMAFEMCDNHK